MIGEVVIRAHGERAVSLPPMTKEQAMGLPWGTPIVALVSDSRNHIVRGHVYHIHSSSFDANGRWPVAMLDHTTDRVFVATYHSWRALPRGHVEGPFTKVDETPWTVYSKHTDFALAPPGFS